MVIHFYKEFEMLYNKIYCLGTEFLRKVLEFYESNWII